MLKTVISSFRTGKSKSELNDPFNVQKVLFHDHDNITIFDVGAYVGDVTKTYRGIFPLAMIYCFEPFADRVLWTIFYNLNLSQEQPSSFLVAHV